MCVFPADPPANIAGGAHRIWVWWAPVFLEGFAQWWAIRFEPGDWDNLGVRLLNLPLFLGLGLIMTDKTSSDHVADLQGAIAELTNGKLDKKDARALVTLLGAVAGLASAACLAAQALGVL